MIWCNIIYVCTLELSVFITWTEATLPGQVLSTVQILWQGFDEPTSLRGACHIKATLGPLLLKLLPSFWWRSTVMFLSQLFSCNITLISTIALFLCLNNFSNASVALKLGHYFDWSQTLDPSLLVLSLLSATRPHPKSCLSNRKCLFMDTFKSHCETNKQTEIHALSSSLCYSWVWPKHVMHCLELTFQDQLSLLHSES